MIKLTFCLRRLPHLSREQFQTYWREQHAPLVAKHAKTLGVLRYVQLHTGRAGAAPNCGYRQGWGRCLLGST